MAMPRSLSRWLGLPGRVALILGLGALSTTGARADAPDQENRTASGDLLIRSEGGRIYFSEGGRDFEELRLRDTAEARHLKQLLEKDDAAASPAGLRLSPTILAGGGGAGFHWSTPAEKTDKPGNTGTSDKEGTSKKTGPPQNKDTTGTGKKG